MEPLRDNVVFIALGLAVVDLVLVVLFILQMRRLGKLRKAQQTVLGVHDERDIVAHAAQLAEQVRNLRDAVEALDARIDVHKAELDHAFTLRAVERFDAFHDIGGEQSASIALLDRHRSGVVVSSIHSRDYARLYVKELREGVPDRALSPEEERVVAAAVSAPADGGPPLADGVPAAPLPSAPPTSAPSPGPAGLPPHAAPPAEPPDADAPFSEEPPGPI